MEIQKLRITEDERIFLDDFEVKNIKGFEVKSNAEGLAELALIMDVKLGKEVRQ